MTKKILFLFCCVSTLLISVEAQQTTAVPTRVQAQTTLNKLSKAGGVNSSEVMVGIPPPSGELIGSGYLDDNWLKGTILLYQKDTRIEGYLLKYDIQTDQLEILESTGTTKVLEGVRAKSFHLFTDSSRTPRHFINARDYKKEGVSMTGFFEILVEGPLPLLKKIEVVIQKANYVKEFDTGSRDDKIIQKEAYYYADKNNVNKVPRKKLTVIFKDHSQEMEQFIKVNDLNTKNPSDVHRIFEKYNAFFKK
jgi:hypothetical protein